MTTRHELHATRKISLMILTGIMLCAGLVIPSKFAGALGNAPGDIAAYLVGLRGEVEVYVSGEVENEWWEKTRVRQWIPASKAQALRLEDRIRTGRGRVRIEFTDRREGDPGAGPSIFNLGDNTEVSISDFEINFGWTERDGYLVFN